MPDASLSTIAWRKAPFLRLLLFLIAGICLGIYAQFPPIPYVSVSLCAGLVALLMLHLQSGRYGSRWLFGALLALWMTGLGWWRVESLADAKQPNHFAHLIPADSIAFFVGRVTDRQVSGDKLRLAMQLERAGPQPEQLTEISGQLLTYIPLDEASEGLFPGSRLLWKGKAQKLEPPLNPLAFDFSAYQARQNRYYQMRVDSTDWTLLKKPAFSLLGIALSARHRLLRIYRKYLPTPNELAVGTALVLGSREDMQNEVRNAYTQTGAIHVLAVSGLHVGIVAMGLQWLLALVPLRGRSKRWLLLVLNLVGIWSFALLTGFSPSVQRSAVMFSLLLVGQTFQRPHQVYNTLASSAFLLLFYNPWLLLDVGFQLSYLAVAGIVLFHQHIYAWFYTPNKVLDYCWNLTAVGIAAQLATFPLSLYYFHQFPVYFWLSGLMVVPVSPFILGLGIALLALGGIPILGPLVGSVLYGLIWLMNKGIFWLNSLPGGLITNLWIGAAELVLLYGVIVMLGLFAETKRPAWMLAGLAALAISLGLAAYTSWNRQTQQATVIYHLPRATVVDWFTGKRRYSLAVLGQEAKDSTALYFAAGNYRSFRAAPAVIELSGIDTAAHHRAEQWQFRAGFVLFKQQAMVFVEEVPQQAPPAEPLPVEVVLIRGNPRLRLADCTPYYAPKHWVFDGSNSRYRTSAWLKECAELGLPCHATAEHGALVLE